MLRLAIWALVAGAQAPIAAGQGAQAPPPTRTPCEMALAAGVSAAATDVCQADQQEKAALALPPGAEKTRQLDAVLDLYERAARALTNDAARTRVLAESVRLLDKPLLNRPGDLERVLHQLIALQPQDLTWVFRLSRLQEDWEQVDLAEDTLIAARRRYPMEAAPARALAQFYARRVTALQPPVANQRTAATIPGEPDDQGVYRVGGALGPPRRVDQPQYPPAARDAGIEGVVILEIVVGTDGLVSDARVVRSIPMLDEAALKAVWNYRYEPTLINGQPVPVRSTVTVNFTTTR